MGFDHRAAARRREGAGADGCRRARARPDPLCLASYCPGPPFILRGTAEQPEYEPGLVIEARLDEEPPHHWNYRTGRQLSRGTALGEGLHRARHGPAVIVGELRADRSSPGSRPSAPWRSARPILARLAAQRNPAGRGL